jgi:crotonobetainyl-CoA:carnitine CoA-transferase CaiB-like acyl-CoA transferase
VGSDRQPLDDLHVVELGSGIAGAFCAKLLAGFGADVVKVEPPAGDATRRLGPFADDVPGPERSLLFLYLNTGKRSVTLDTASPTGRSLLAQLVAGADIVVDTLGLGVLAGLGLPYEQIAVLNPGAIVVSISPFGEDGPYHQYVGTELVLLALGGLLKMVGEPDREPVRLGGYQAQYLTGISAFTGALAALHARDRDGLGQWIPVSAQESVAFTEWKSSVYEQATGKPRQRGGRQSQWTVLRASDGFVAFVYQDDNWPQVIGLIGDERLADERFRTRAGRLAHREEIKSLLEGWTRRHPKRDVYHRAQAQGIPVGLVADMADLLDSPQYRERAFFAEVSHPATGPMPYAGLPARLNGERPAVSRAPLLGEHNLAVYGSDLGLSSTDLVRLHERGVV